MLSATPCSPAQGCMVSEGLAERGDPPSGDPFTAGSVGGTSIYRLAAISRSTAAESMSSRLDNILVIVATQT
jgi:hypothetical protein